jgi:hypothetical protein
MYSIEQTSIPARVWWGRRRLRYNVGLIVAGLLAFACYVAVVFWGISLRAIPDPGAVTGLTTLFQAACYLVLMVIANICYWLGPLSERLIQPKDIDRYRRITYGLGFWFSVLLPFGVPVSLACLYLARPAWWHG